jgi:hypothetical protein
VSLTVTPVNDVPSLGVSPNPGQTPEDTPLAFSVMTDDGDPEFEQQMRLHVVTPPQHGTFSPGFVIQIMDPGMPLVLYYTPAPNYSGPDFFVLAVSDDAQAGPPADLTSPLVTVGVVVTPVNDPPVLAGIEATAVPYTENDPATAITGTITTSDVDNTNLASATVQITGNYQNGQDVLNAPGWTWNPAAGALTLTSSNTLANFQAALRAVKYQNTSESPSAATRTVTFKVNDGAADSNVLTRIITVTPVNDPPTAANGTVTTSKNTERVFGASEFNFSDGDAGDSLSAAQITTLATNGALKWNNGTSWVLVVTNQEIAKADIDAGKLEFVPFANETGSPYATFGFKVKDTGGPTLSTSVYTMTVNVTATLLAAGVAPAGPAETVPLAQADLQPIVNEAIARWAATGLAAQSIDAMAKARFVVTDLPGAQLGLAAGNTIYLDANAAGFGWFVDPTPTKDEEFARIAPEDELRAIGAGVIDRMDLLSVVEHELGHLLGLRDLDSIVPSLMGSSLNKGVRRTVTATEVDAVFATGDFLT